MSTLSKFSKKGSACTHDEARAVACYVCGKKVKDKKGGVGFVNDRLSNLVVSMSIRVTQCRISLTQQPCVAAVG